MSAPSPQPLVPSLYVHVPFCAHRCGYCDFVTVAAQPDLHDRYVAALAAEWKLRADEVGGSDHRFETVFVGGGTPSLLEPAARARLLDWIAGLTTGVGAEVTMECNPETVTPELARDLVARGVTRISLGAQSFQPDVLDMLERRATPDIVRAAVHTLRDAGVDNLSLDVIWGVPGQGLVQVEADIAELVALAPDHVSAYELEFKPGTRLTHRHGSAAAAVGAASDDFYDAVVDGLGAAGYEWYETANFARDGRYCRHNLTYWTQGDYLGLGIGAFGTVGGRRHRTMPNLPRWLAALEAGELPVAQVETLDPDTRRAERIMLALRLDRPCHITAADLGEIVDPAAPALLARHGLATVTWEDDRSYTGEESPEYRDLLHPRETGVSIHLTRRGRMLLNEVLDRLLLLDASEL